MAAEVLEFGGPSYAAKGIAAEEAIPADLPLIMGDADRLRQVVLNLCKNAVDAMPQGGTLMLRGTESGENVILEIIDTGVGVPQLGSLHLYDDQEFRHRPWVNDRPPDRLDAPRAAHL